MKAIFRVNSATPFAVSAVRYLCTVHFDSCIRIALAAGLGLLASFAACADSVTTNRYYQASAQAWGGNGYTEALWKLNGEGEAVSPAKGENGCFNEYVAALGWGRGGLVRSLASGNNSFTGDGLTIGDDKDGTFLLRYGGNTLTVDHLTLVRGLITSGVGSETLASSNPILVRSTTAGPFYFSIGNGRSITIDGPLYSEDDSALVVINRYSLEDKEENNGEMKGGTIYFTGDNSAYKGKIKVDYLNYYNKGYTGTDSNTNIVLNVNSNNALGGTPAAAMPDALTLSNGGTLAVGYATSSEAPFAPGGGLRGLTVSNGGRVSSGSALYFAMPVTSSDGSTLRFYNSNLTLASSFSGSVSVDCTGVSSLAFANGFEWTSTGTLTLPNGTVVSKGEGYTKMVAEVDTLGYGRSYAANEVWSTHGVIADDSTTHYLDYGKEFRTPEASPCEFPAGAKVTIVNGTFTLKTPDFKIGALALCNGAKFDFANGWQAQSVSGGVTISSVNDFAVKFMTGGNHAVNASLTGNGTIVYGHRDNNTDNGSITVGGDNSGYIGSMRAEGNGITAKFSAANGLGGSPSTVLPQGLAVASGATVEFTGSAAISVNQPNRGMYIEASGTVKTAPDVTWKGPLAFSATDAFLSKTGSGTLALEGACGAGSITVFEGGLRFVGNTAACDVAVGANSSLGGNGTISGAVSATAGAKLEFSETEALTFTGTADLTNFSIDTTGLDTTKAYTVAKGTTSLPSLTEAQASAGWRVSAANGNVVLKARTTYQWTGSDTANPTYWRTAANWSSDDGSGTYPGENDEAVFDNDNAMTLIVAVSTDPSGVSLPIKTISVSEGAGALTIRIADDLWNTRPLRFSSLGDLSATAPSANNIANSSSNPITFFGRGSSNFKVQFGASAGAFAITPGNVFDCPVEVASGSTLWLLPQDSLRTDNAEMNKTVFKGELTMGGSTIKVGENHQLVFNGAKLSGTGTLVIDGACEAGSVVLNGCRLRVRYADAEKLTVTSADSKLRVARTVVGDNVELYQRPLGAIMLVR